MNRRGFFGSITALFSLPLLNVFRKETMVAAADPVTLWSFKGVDGQATHIGFRDYSASVYLRKEDIENDLYMNRQRFLKLNPRPHPSEAGYFVDRIEYDEYIDHD